MQEPGIYEVHTNFLDKFRGRNAIRASLAAYRWMFTHTDCMVLLTKVPEDNKAAAQFCRIVGATREFERKKIWPTKDGLIDLSFWALRYDDWIRKTPSLKESGKRFHDRLDAEYTRLKFEQPLHEDEDCHDLYVGICAEMIFAGQPEKGVILYNRWADFSGYGRIKLVSINPLMIDIGEALLFVKQDTFTVLQVRGKTNG